MSYYRKNYFRSDDWQDLRAAVIADRCPDRRCEFCGRSTQSVDVPHFDYRNLFDVKPEDLVVVCRSCHILVHEILDAHKEWKVLHPRERRRKLFHEFFGVQSKIERLWRECYRKVRIFTIRLRRNIIRDEVKLFRYLILYFRLGFALDESRIKS